MTSPPYPHTFTLFSVPGLMAALRTSHCSGTRTTSVQSVAIPTLGARGPAKPQKVIGLLWEQCVNVLHGVDFLSVGYSSISAPSFHLPPPPPLLCRGV